MLKRVRKAQKNINPISSLVVLPQRLKAMGSIGSDELWGGLELIAGRVPEGFRGFRGC